MKKYVKKYIEFWGYGEQDFIPCIVCGERSADVHHLEPKGMGGSKEKDNIENLVALCRRCHDLCHNDKNFNQLVKNMQEVIMQDHEQNKT
jgi:hypothetical protein